MKRLRRFLNIPRLEKNAFVISLAAMTVTRLALFFFTPRQIARYLDRMSHTYAQTGTEQTIALRRLIRRIMQARHYAPVPTTCLSESLAAQAVLTRYGHRGELRIGIHKSDGRFKAHAWLECEDRILIGTPSPDGEVYVPLAGAERLAG